MKYYTPELIAMGQSENDDVLDEQDRLWEDAAAHYVAYLDTVRAYMPPGLKHITESYYLHDATILSIGKRKAEFVLVLQLDTPPQSILTFTYDLLSEPAIQKEALPAKARFCLNPPLWQYNEFERVIDQSGGWRESLLLSNGWEITLHFRDVKVEEFDAILPIHGNGHLRQTALVPTA